MKTAVSIISAIIVALTVGLGFALQDCKASEVAGALSSILGGLIGALGAAVAVYLTLLGQRKEDRERIRGAIVREVIEFSRLVVGHLTTCENIRAQIIALPIPRLAEAMQMPAPIIYPAVADRIGLLPSPQNVVAFYARILEAGVMAQTISRDPRLQTSNLQENNIRTLVESWLDILQFARGIIENSQHDQTFDQAVQQSILKDIADQSTDARKNFKIT